MMIQIGTKTAQHLGVMAYGYFKGGVTEAAHVDMRKEDGTYVTLAFSTPREAYEFAEKVKDAGLALERQIEKALAQEEA